MSSSGDPGHGHVIVTGHDLDLTIEDVVWVARGNEDGSFPHVELHPETIDRLRRMRTGIQQKIDENEVMYGVNTGCGSNRDITITRDHLDRYQLKYIKTHAVGFGDFIDPEVIRAMMLLRVNSFAQGYSGISIELCEAILTLLNHNIVPAVPRHGSVGASGDLIPLAHLGAVIIGRPWAKVFYQGEIVSANELIEELGLLADGQEALHVLGPKEAMGLTNGATYILSITVLAVHDLSELVDLADLGLALHVEAIRGEMNAFDDRVHKARRHEGQRDSAEHIRNLLRGSRRATREAQQILFPIDKCSIEDKPCAKRCSIVDSETGARSKGPRVQDRYSVRCTPQVHGGVRTALEHLRCIVEHEINAATDNPLIFEREGGFDVLSAGNFHGTPLALPIDYVLNSMAVLAHISNKRFYALLESIRSFGLPNDLSGGKDEDNTGFMIVQYASAGLVMKIQTLAAGHSRLSIDTSAGQEDFVSNGANGALALREAVDLLAQVLATEILAGCQGIDLGNKHLPEELQLLGEGTQLAYNLVREHISMLDEDRDLYPDLQTMLQLIEDGSLHAEIADL